MNTDVLTLVQQAEESLSAARLLLNEGYCGFATSRTYYTMLYVAEALLASIGEAYSSHGAVIGGFGRKFAKTGKLDPKFHRGLIDAHDVLNVGDYGVGAEISSEQANELITQAKQFVQAGKEFL